MPQKSISKKLLDKVITAPETAIEQFDLIYISEDHLTIERKRRKNKFIYEKNGKILNKQSDIKRINELMIPPAWEHVKITHLSNGHLQAVGRDEKQRKQYLYHPIWNKVRNQTKFHKMVDFAKHLPNIRKQTDLYLKQASWTKTKVLALIIKLMEETNIRIGNEQYAKHNKTYGLSTLRSKHLHVFKNKIRFEFVGKKGKEHTVTLKNKKLMRLVMQCEEIPGWELFKYYDENGVKHRIESSMINEFLHDITGTFYTSKDFRTWSASVIFLEVLLEQEPYTNEKELKSNLLKAYDHTAKTLGNTRAICRDYYVHPAVIVAYENDDLHTAYNKALNDEKTDSALSISEQTLLKLIKNYKPDVA